MRIRNSLEDYLINYLEEYNEIEDDSNLDERLAIRALMNITKPVDLDDEFYEKQDQYLKQLLSSSVVINCEDINKIKPHIALLEGDITLLNVDVIVNPTDETLEGSYVALNDSIGSAIHSFAGLQLRRDCMKLIQEQYENEKVGNCKVTKGYNLPCKYIFHTVIPENDSLEDLSKCYLNALKRCEHCDVKSIAFPVITDVEGMIPFKEVVNMVIEIVRDYFTKYPNTKIETVVFVLKNSYQYQIYEKVIIGNNKKLVKKFSK